MKKTFCFEARPHPSPLPQERENGDPAFGKIGAPVSPWRSFVNGTEMRKAQRAHERSGNAQIFSLSRGERVGVRASVGQTFHRHAFLLLAVFFLGSSLLSAETLLLTGATIHTGSGATIPQGDVG